MKKEDEKRYLRFSYLVMVLATLVMLGILVGIFYMEHRLLRTLFFSSAYVVGTVMFFLMGMRERHVGIYIRAIIYFIGATICAVLSIIYFIRRMPAVMESIGKFAEVL